MTNTIMLTLVFRARISANNRIHPDRKERRSFLALLFLLVMRSVWYAN